ncbi:site-specific DNA-methyltransferase [Acetomicrobium sp.]|uniref:site-specific DNA-methyltransferase n=1 Tax=Acetomicrobium sp. TaxID=1872099 RepID=UPI0028716235|nr:site-specific DNA-methyltransferase [Acetomicrobium sp.]MDR9768876.1 site-specific DNA-methyltransferase [Acetomicrobium sp.]
MGNYISQSKEVVLSWPYKDCILEGGQEDPDEKRKEVFHNEILAPDEIDRLLDPKAFTNFKRIDKDGEHPVEEIKPTDNLIIKGNNLLVLHSLNKRFNGKVKMIYIDPPYNTGNDEFMYNDSFNHSTWLTFMKNRLEIARELLRDDGVIFVQCDDREHAYLKVLMDEIFSRDKFISSIAIKVKAPSGIASGGRLIFDVKENILVYNKKDDVVPYENLIEKEFIDRNSKTIEQYNMILEDEGIEGETATKLETNTGTVEIKRRHNYKITRIPINEIDDINEYYANNIDKIFRVAVFSGDIWKKISSSMPDNELYSYYHTPSKGKHKGEKIKYYIYKKGEILFLRDFTKVDIINNKKTIFKTEHISNIITANLWQGIANEGSVTLKNGKKPEELLRMLIALVTKEGDLVMDFFMGTGTTCAVAHKMGRQYIGVEQLDYGENSAVVRLKNVINGDPTGISKTVGWQGGGDFVYCELMELNEKFVGDIQAAQTTEELLEIWEQMKKQSFLSYRIDPKDIDRNVEEFKDLSIKDQKKFLMELLDKNDLYVNYSEIEDKQYGVSEEDVQLNRKFYTEAGR